MNDLQQRIDDLAYPPTMTYRLADLAATGVLADRAAIFDAVRPPELLRAGRRFLDVGANKGYFSLRAAHAQMEVTALDPGRAYHALLHDLLIGSTPHAPHHVERTGFRDWIPAHRFDSAMLGNVAHYVYKECGGTWDWLAKLAAVTEDDGHVYCEGPTGMECADMAAVLAGPAADRFSWPMLLREAWRWFDVVGERGPATRYTPDRHVFVLRRHARLRLDADELLARCPRPLRVLPGKLAVHTDGALVLKLSDTPVPVDAQIRIEVAAAAPWSTPVVGWLVRRGAVVGWAEPYVGSAPLRFHSRDLDVFERYVDRQIHALHNGFFDEDPGQPNWTCAPVAGAWPKLQLVHFDKNLLPPRACATKDALRRAKICFGQSYSAIGSAIVDRILEAQESGDTTKLFATFEQLRKERTWA